MIMKRALKALEEKGDVELDSKKVYKAVSKSKLKSDVKERDRLMQAMVVECDAKNKNAAVNIVQFAQALRNLP